MSFEDSEAVKIELKAHTKNYSMLRMAYLQQLYHNGNLSFVELFNRVKDMVSQASRFYGEQTLSKSATFRHSFQEHTQNVVASIIAHRLRLQINLEKV